VSRNPFDEIFGSIDYHALGRWEKISGLYFRRREAIFKDDLIYPALPVGRFAGGAETLPLDL
jgi:hypothetical protein